MAELAFSMLKSATLSQYQAGHRNRFNNSRSPITGALGRSGLFAVTPPSNSPDRPCPAALSNSSFVQNRSGSSKSGASLAGIFREVRLAKFLEISLIVERHSCTFLFFVHKILIHTNFLVNISENTKIFEPKLTENPVLLFGMLRKTAERAGMKTLRSCVSFCSKFSLARTEAAAYSPPHTRFPRIYGII